MLIVSPARVMLFFPRKVNSISLSKTENNLLEIMAMMRRAASRWNVAARSVFAGHKDRIGVNPMCGKFGSSDCARVKFLSGSSAGIVVAACDEGWVTVLFLPYWMVHGQLVDRPRGVGIEVRFSVFDEYAP